MTRHPTASRVHRSPTEPDDLFIARVIQLGLWAKEHTRILTAITVAVVLATAGTLYYRGYQRTLRQQAATQFNQVRQTAASGNRPLAIRDLESFIQRFDGTPAAQEARVVLARVYLDDGKPDKAAEAARPLADELDQPLGISAAFLLAAAREAQGQPQEAEALYLRIADRARLGYQRRDALDDAARIRLERGDAAGAVQLYERILENTPPFSPDRPMYEIRLGEARARASARA